MPLVRGAAGRHESEAGMQVEMVLQAVLSKQAGWDSSLDSSLALSGTNIVPTLHAKRWTAHHGMPHAMHPS